jgi:hypothetical protein
MIAGLGGGPADRRSGTRGAVERVERAIERGRGGGPERRRPDRGSIVPEIAASEPSGLTVTCISPWWISM